MARASTAVHPAHRLALSAAEWSVLARHSPVELPPDVAPAPRTPGEPARRQAAEGLVGRGVLTPVGDDPLGYPPVPAVAVNLALLAERRIGLRVEVGVGERGVRAVYAVGEPLAASLFALGDGAVELSMFDATRLGWELVRAVPTPEQLAGGSGSRLRRALGGDGPAAALAGRLPLAALAAFSSDRPAPPDILSTLDGGQRALAQALGEQTVGVLRCVVSGRAGDDIGVGQVVWLATDGGWVGVRPQPPVAGRAVVELVPVRREELGTWVAPYVAQLTGRAAHPGSGERA
jgi:hypothetical protein